jgi:dipeptidyl aminopeptidase/acylaminoacyl peptidase
MEPMKNELLTSIKFISSLKSNPSQTSIAFLVSETDIDNNKYQDSLYTYDGAKVSRIKRFKKRLSFIFETDHTLLVPFGNTKAEEKQIKEDQITIYYRYNLLDQTWKKAYEFKFPVSIIDVLGDQLLLKASLSKDQHQLYLLDGDERKTWIKHAKEDKLYEEIEEIPFYSNQTGFIANVRTQLFIYDTVTLQLRPLVDSNFDVRQVRVSKDQQTIYYSGQDMKGVRSLTTHIFSYHVKTKKTSILYHEDQFSFAKLLVFGSSIIVAASDMKAYGINQNYDFYELKDKKLYPFSKYGLSIGNSIGSDVRLGEQVTEILTEDYYDFIATENDHSILMRLSKDGDITPVLTFEGSLDGIAKMHKDILGIALYKQKLQEVYRLNPSSKPHQVITHLNKNILKNHYVAKPKSFVVKKPAHDVQGWVLYPKNYDENKTYPAILDIHGGPKTVYGKIYYHEMQVWANQGYFVMFANPRGSDGKGDVFADIRGKYGSIDYQDLMDFVALVVKKIPSIDQKRLGVTGGSYGGFMTNWIITHTDIFKAACTQRSITNWLTFHSTSDIGFYFSKDQTSGHPLTDTEKLWEASPLKYIDHIKTPLLIIHSDQDYRCPIEQAMQLFTLLKEKGVETRFVWFKGENHELSRSGLPQARQKRLNEILDWFDTHL